VQTQIFVIYDSAVDAYLNPMFFRSKGEALRSFGVAVNDPNTQFHVHPGDFTLFEIGAYDDATGAITQLDAKISLGNAIEFKETDGQLPIINGDNHVKNANRNETQLQRGSTS